LRYSWHLFFDPDEATQIEITFTPHGEGTLVRLEQSGWERLGAAGPARRGRTRDVWTGLTARFASACGAREA
jgi:uncharacterized protein YndB with AHSA1/START domain